MSDNYIFDILYNIYMAKKHLNLYIEDDIINMVKAQNINISLYVEEQLRATEGTHAMSRRRHNQLDHKPICIKNETLSTYILIVELSDVTKKHLKEVEKFLTKYLKFVKYKIDQDESLKYFNMLKEDYSRAYYIKQMFQIKKFLRYLKITWIDDIRLPSQPIYTPKHVTMQNIQDAIKQFKRHQYKLQIKAILLLGFSSGLRAEELYGLKINDIDLKNRIVYVRHSKTGKARVSFFSNVAKTALIKWIEYYNQHGIVKNIFGQNQLTKIFHNSELKIKDARKGFSQEWTRRKGDYAVKELLLGHSIRKSVDLQHYCLLTEQELKQHYDKIWR